MGIRSFRPVTSSAPSRSAPHPFGLLPVWPPNIQCFPWPVSQRGQSNTRSAPYRGLQLYNRPTTTLNRKTQPQVAENYLSELPAYLLLGLHCENMQE